MKLFRRVVCVVLVVVILIGCFSFSASAYEVSSASPFYYNFGVAAPFTEFDWSENFRSYGCQGNVSSFVFNFYGYEFNDPGALGFQFHGNKFSLGNVMWELADFNDAYRENVARLVGCNIPANTDLHINFDIGLGRCNLADMSYSSFSGIKDVLCIYMYGEVMDTDQFRLIDTIYSQGIEDSDLYYMYQPYNSRRGVQSNNLRIRGVITTDQVYESFRFIVQTTGNYSDSSPDMYALLDNTNFYMWSEEHSIQSDILDQQQEMTEIFENNLDAVLDYLADLKGQSSLDINILSNIEDGVLLACKTMIQGLLPYLLNVQGVNLSSIANASAEIVKKLSAINNNSMIISTVLDMLLSGVDNMQYLNTSILQRLNQIERLLSDIKYSLVNIESYLSGIYGISGLSNDMLSSIYQMIVGLYNQGNQTADYQGELLSFLEVIFISNNEIYKLLTLNLDSVLSSFSSINGNTADSVQLQTEILDQIVQHILPYLLSISDDTGEVNAALAEIVSQITQHAAATPFYHMNMQSTATKYEGDIADSSLDYVMTSDGLQNHMVNFTPYLSPNYGSVFLEKRASYNSMYVLYDDGYQSVASMYANDSSRLATWHKTQVQPGTVLDVHLDFGIGKATLDSVSYSDPENFPNVTTCSFMGVTYQGSSSSYVRTELCSAKYVPSFDDVDLTSGLYFTRVSSSEGEVLTNNIQVRGRVVVDALYDDIAFYCWNRDPGLTDGQSGYLLYPYNDSYITSKPYDIQSDILTYVQRLFSGVDELTGIGDDCVQRLDSVLDSASVICEELSSINSYLDSMVSNDTEKIQLLNSCIGYLQSMLQDAEEDDIWLIAMYELMNQITGSLSDISDDAMQRNEMIADVLVGLLSVLTVLGDLEVDVSEILVYFEDLFPLIEENLSTVISSLGSINSNNADSVQLQTEIRDQIVQYILPYLLSISDDTCEVNTALAEIVSQITQHAAATPFYYLNINEGATKYEGDIAPSAVDYVFEPSYSQNHVVHFRPYLSPNYGSVFLEKRMSYTSMYAVYDDGYRSVATMYGDSSPLSSWHKTQVQPGTVLDVHLDFGIGKAILDGVSYSDPENYSKVTVCSLFGQTYQGSTSSYVRTDLCEASYVSSFDDVDLTSGLYFTFVESPDGEVITDNIQVRGRVVVDALYDDLCLYLWNRSVSLSDDQSGYLVFPYNTSYITSKPYDIQSDILTYVQRLFSGVDELTGIGDDCVQRLDSVLDSASVICEELSSINSYLESVVSNGTEQVQLLASCITYLQSLFQDAEEDDEWLSGMYELMNQIVISLSGLTGDVTQRNELIADVLSALLSVSEELSGSSAARALLLEYLESCLELLDQIKDDSSVTTIHITNIAMNSSVANDKLDAIIDALTKLNIDITKIYLNVPTEEDDGFSLFDLVGDVWSLLISFASSIWRSVSGAFSGAGDLFDSFDSDSEIFDIYNGGDDFWIYQCKSFLSF